jgi:hypothetical protein
LKAAHTSDAPSSTIGRGAVTAKTPSTRGFAAADDEGEGKNERAKGRLEHCGKNKVHFLIDIHVSEILARRPDVVEPVFEEVSAGIYR